MSIWPWDSGSSSQRLSKRMYIVTNRWLEGSNREYKGTMPVSNGMPESASDSPNLRDW